MKLENELVRKLRRRLNWTTLNMIEGIEYISKSVKELNILERTYFINKRNKLYQKNYEKEGYISFACSFEITNKAYEDTLKFKKKSNLYKLLKSIR